MWAINSNAQVIIFKTENLFRDLTTIITENKVDVNAILSRSLSHPDILSAFDSLIANSELKPEKKSCQRRFTFSCLSILKYDHFTLPKMLFKKYKLAAKSKLKQKSCCEAAPE